MAPPLSYAVQDICAVDIISTSTSLLCHILRQVTTLVGEVWKRFGLAPGWRDSEDHSCWSGESGSIHVSWGGAFASAPGSLRSSGDWSP